MDNTDSEGEPLPPSLPPNSADGTSSNSNDTNNPNQQEIKVFDENGNRLDIKLFRNNSGAIYQQPEWRTDHAGRGFQGYRGRGGRGYRPPRGIYPRGNSTYAPHYSHHTEQAHPPPPPRPLARGGYPYNTRGTRGSELPPYNTIVYYQPRPTFASRFPTDSTAYRGYRGSRGYRGRFPRGGPRFPRFGLNHAGNDDISSHFHRLNINAEESVAGDGDRPHRSIVTVDDIHFEEDVKHMSIENMHKLLDLYDIPYEAIAGVKEKLVERVITLWQLLNTNVEVAGKPLVEEETKTCCICFDNLKDTIILPCGHLATCYNCCQQCQLCPICRKVIASRFKIYDA